MIKTRRGLDLPISGTPSDVLDQKLISSVALLGADYPELKPTMAVREGDRVKAGDLLFTDKKTPGVRYTSPASGVVTSINRGARRAFISLVIEVEGDEAVQFAAHTPESIANLDRAQIGSILLESGQWTALRTRPYSRVPVPGSVPDAIFVTAIDTRPLAPDPAPVIEAQREAFDTGISLLAKLTDGPVHVCMASGASFSPDATSARVETFDGPHPAGLAGTHIHFLAPAGANRTVWSVGYQDTIAIGRLFMDGELYLDRVISLAGPVVRNPRRLQVRVGASTADLTEDELDAGEHRIISGSVLDGRKADRVTAFLGRLHNQVSVLEEGRRREFLQFVAPGADKFSLTRLFVSWLMPGKQHPFTTSTGGSERAMVPLGTFEDVMPLDILPTQLLRALLVQDVATAMDLGCLELDEEDLALCTFACPGKYEYGPYLRQMLSNIEAEG